MESTEVTPELIVRAILEIGFLLLVIGYLLAATDFRRRLAPLGAGAVATLLIFLGAWGAIQAIDRWQYDYPQAVSFIPFTRFAMYQAQLKESVSESYSWQAELTDGSTREVNIADEFSTIGLPPLSTRMRVLLGWMEDEGTPEQRADAERELELYAEGLLASLEADGVEVSSLSFARVTGTPGDENVEELDSWNIEELTR
ncbi:hypothetical protein [Homoserinibacter sp. GY 40078]|uniref:hypothetical protein n=1 Tax=Homoserinibacter sp. GY 40078 TaxID=2603275 RepID=UPI0011CA7A4E|nr:hypothetical protein [Homoserinibacter sp. GY 40078]TXK16247.1 hypothetical protein FVQ89_13390 [Homoserinibacter sp. GY 40078]